MSQASVNPPKLLPMVKIPTSIVCPTCKEETGLTPDKIIEMTIDDNICCPICNSMIYSCLPEKPSFKGSGFWVNGTWTEYD